MCGAWMDSSMLVPILSSLCGAGCDGRERESSPRRIQGFSPVVQALSEHHAAGEDASSKFLDQQGLGKERMVLRTTHVPIFGRVWSVSRADLYTGGYTPQAEDEQNPFK